MLQNIRDNSQGWIAKTIIGIIVVLLALTGFEAIFNSSGNARNAAEVNGEEISLDELNQAVNMQRRQLMQQLGSDFDASLFDDKLMRDSALGALIDRTLLLQGARDADFAFSQAALDQLILQTPEFAVDGVFNAARFDQVIQQMGYTRMQFRQLLEQEMLIGQLRAGISGSGFVTDQQIERFAQLERQTRDFASITVAADSSAVQVSDEEARQYYEANTERFRSPEQVVLEYVELNKEAYFDEVDASEEELQELYRQQIGNLAENSVALRISSSRWMVQAMPRPRPSWRRLPLNWQPVGISPPWLRSTPMIPVRPTRGETWAMPVRAFTIRHSKMRSMR